MQQNLEIRQTQRQEQQLTHQQLLGLEILLAAMPELEQKINAEIEINPTLELVKLGTEEYSGNPVEGYAPPPEVSQDQAAQAAEKDESLASLVQMDETWRDHAPFNSRQDPGDDERRQFFFDSLEYEPTLQEFLLEQLRQAENLDVPFMTLCEEIIGSIDETGYLRTHLADIAVAGNVEVLEVKKALALIQSFEPPGVGAADLRECLLLQLERFGRRNSPAWKLVDEHLEDLGRNQIPKIARDMNLSITELQIVLDELKKLQPFPGSTVSPAKTEFVLPEVVVQKNENGEWQVTSNRDYSPRLRISRLYLDMLENPDVPAEAKSYLRQKINSSRSLMRALEQRRSTIEEIARILVDRQRDFFEQGVEYMRPLTMSTVADDIGVHETTVSRAIANKYMQTPHGLLPFRHFFTTGYRSTAGEELSSLSIKQRIQEIINSENPRKPLSDEKMKQVLTEQGLDVARRTVAKYREELGIQASNLRKSY